MGVHEHRQRDAEHRPRHGEEGVHGQRVVVQGAVGERVQGGLDELACSGDADHGAVDAAEGGEAEDFGGVVARLGGGGCVSREVGGGGGKAVRERREREEGRRRERKERGG